MSGRDLETTFGNSLRNLLYFFTYMVYHGISLKPWLDQRYFPMVAGDDLAILVLDLHGLLPLIREAI